MPGPRSSVVVCDPGQVCQCVTREGRIRQLHIRQSGSSLPASLSNTLMTQEGADYQSDFCPAKPFHPGSTGRDGKAIETMVNGKLGLTQADNTE